MKGALVFVGSGIQLGRDITRRALSEIEAADRVFCMADAFMLTWLQSIRPDAESLHTCYGENKDRRQTYREMEATLLDAVREGNRVCAVFYGHPGVFADVPHAAIGKARGEGYPVRMDPGISAEACITADLGLDPGKRGSQSMEATQFLVYDRQIDPGALLLLWQVGLAGDLSCKRFDTTEQRLQVLTDKLCRWYSPEHEVILYEAAVVPFQEYRAERIPLSKLPRTETSQITTLVVPPQDDLKPDEATLNALGYSVQDLA